MSELSAELRAFAEIPQRWLVQPAGIDFRDEGRYFALAASTWSAVVALDVDAGELEEVVAEVRAAAAPGAKITWWLGPSARPPDASERLLELGLRRADPPRLDALIATEPPPPAPEDVTVTRVETLDDYRTLKEIQWEAFRTPPERRRIEEATIDEAFAIDRSNCEIFLAHLDGRPAGTARFVIGSIGVFLIGGATAGWARGRGAYRALVRARWDAAVARGTPVLVTHADPATSGPILRRLGFRCVCELSRLEEP